MNNVITPTFDEWAFQETLKEAKKIFKENGEIIGAVFHCFNNDHKFIVHTTFATDVEKEKSWALMKVIMSLYSVKHYVVMCETWFVQSKDKKLDCQPRDHPNKKEGLMVTSVNHKRARMKFIEIIRKRRRGKRVVILDEQKEETDPLGGVLTTFLPDKGETNPFPGLEDAILEKFCEKVGMGIIKISPEEIDKSQFLPE